MNSFLPVRWITLNLFKVSFLLFSFLLVTDAYSASKTILVLGDSLSAEYGLARGQGWVSLLEKKLAEEKIPARVINASISGETSIGGKNRLPDLLNQHHPDIVIIELGGNDALRGLPLNNSEDNFRTIIVSAKHQNAKVLLAGMQVPPNYGKTYTQQFFSMYQKLAQEQKIRLVPFLLEGVANNNQLFQSDRIHPVAAAHPIILQNIWDQLHPLLKK
ncbi:arylesterase [Undibacterium oligocarboniphilum]|uniref:Arylesterase n=1 Tax=Undibacterium oligocarboniphilum TaxID=666702 RepID=A0A850Q8T7_9BURK|nr:arylesterase [Undibacterium oligocarboniphilum]NVO76692.1 arylesterase [Undibacterium oligocarboniphilum]